ncbi:MAG: molybdenum cofactor cytidylyltransferase [Acidobacteriaceae bacterium]|jgi:molybdenum cofactor cytidylyltransferase|nr:molybdenum cofactor cytidylyltransferase [Acidobacteriaceae bacterium]
MAAAANMDRVTGILLAAGSSRRFGADKQSTLLGEEPMLTRAARLLLDAGFVMPIVVLGPRATEHRPLLAGLPLRIVENPAAQSGMASSLVVATDTAGDCDAAVVTVCDQPAVTAEHLQALVAAWRKTGSSIVASSYAGTRGVPALFAATHFAELRQLHGDRGAGPLLARHADSVHAVPLARGEVDIDTPADLERLRP